MLVEKICITVILFDPFGFKSREDSNDAIVGVGKWSTNKLIKDNRQSNQALSLFRMGAILIISSKCYGKVFQREVCSRLNIYRVRDNIFKHALKCRISSDDDIIDPISGVREYCLDFAPIKIDYV